MSERLRKGIFEQAQVQIPSHNEVSNPQIQFKLTNLCFLDVCITSAPDVLKLDFY